MTQILWSTDPATQRALLIVLSLAVLAALTVHLPLAWRALRLWRLERRLRSVLEEEAESAPTGEASEALLEQLRGSMIEPAFREFERRWQIARLHEGLGRAPIRLIDIFDERPLLPFGPRRSLLPVLPGLFLAVGVLAALVGLIPSVGAFGAEAVPADQTAEWMASQLGLALRASAWGFLCAMAASISGRLIEGAHEARSHGLDEVVEQAFGSISPGELAELTRQTQQRSLDTLGGELTRFASELSERLERGLQRIEQSTARSASLVSQEQRGALHTVVQELSLSVRQGVEHHLGELRNALQRAVEHQSSVTGGLAETFQRMVENAQTQDRIARTLADSASSVEDAARSMRASSLEMQPVLEHLGGTSRALAETAGRIDSTQQVVARTAEGVRSSLEHAATGVDDQRKFLELSLGEIRRALLGLEDGLTESLQRALRDVDGALSSTVGQLRDTLAESNETIDRLAVPIRGAEGATRETHVALDRVRKEVEALGQWMSQTAKPLRAGLDDVEGRAEEIARSLVEFTSHSRQMDKTMEALRLEIHEESRRLQGTGSELGRRLKLASDAVGLLESATSEAARRSRLEPPSASGLARERHWASLPVDRDRDPDREPFSAPARSHPVSPDPVLTRSPEAESAPESEAVAGPIAETRRDGTSSPPSERPSEPPSEPGIGSAMEAAGAEWERSRSEADAGPSGYRLGAPRAQGPDPYARFEGRSEPPSNLRHFPTRERELGEDLKLSGLLGPSSRSDAEPPARDEPGRPESEGFEDDDPGSGGHAHPKPEPS